MKRFCSAVGAVAIMVGGVLTGSPASATPWPVTIVKTNTGPASIVAGGSTEAEFTITVTAQDLVPIDAAENGPLLAVVTDFMPNGLQLAEVPAGCTGTVGGTSVTCDVNLSVEPATTIVVRVRAAAQLRPGTYYNCAFVEPPNAPPLDGPEAIAGHCPLAEPEVGEYVIPTAEASVEVTNDADLQLTASQPGQVDPGAGAQITWTAKNAGPSGADAPLTMTATLPQGVTWVGGGEGPWTCTASGQDVTCTYELLATESELGCAPDADTDFICYYSSVILPDAEIPPVVWNVTTAKPGTVAKYDVEATVSSSTTDSKPANNKATATINVTPVDLAISKSAGSPVYVGDEATWTVNVRNAGTIADTAKVTVTDTLPSAAEFVAATGEGWTCEAAGQKVTCTRDGLVKNAATDIVVHSKMTARGDATNKVTVVSGSYEKNTADNSAEKAVRVIRTAQTAAGLPDNQSRVKSGKTEQGQKLTTRVMCRPVKASAAGEVSFCKVTRANGVVRIKVKGNSAMRVTVVQSAKGTAKFRPFVQRKTYIVKP